MDETYTRQLEKRNAELVDKLEQVGALLNSYQKMVKFEIHSTDKMRVDAFDPVEVISLTVNNGAANRVFATIEPSFGYGGAWTIEYGNPFDEEFPREKQRKMIINQEDIFKLYQKWCVESGIAVDQKKLYDRHSVQAVIVKFAMELTGTDHIEFQIAQKFG